MMLFDKNEKIYLNDSTRSLVKRLWVEWVKVHLKLIIAATILMVIVAITTSLYPLLINWTYNLFEEKNDNLLYLIPISILFVAGLKGFSYYGQTILVNSIALKITASLQKAMFSKLLNSEINNLEKQGSGSLISRFTNDTTLIHDALNRLFNNLIRDSLTIIALVAVMFYLDWVLSIITILIYPIASIPIVKIGNKVRGLSYIAQKQIGYLTSSLNQSFSNSRTIKSFQLEEVEILKTNNEIDQRVKNLMSIIKTRQWLEPIIEILGGLSVGIVLTFVGYRMLNGYGSIGEFTGFITALIMAAQPVRAIGTLNAVLQEGLSAVKRIFDILDAKDNIVDSNNPESVNFNDSDIAFNNVSFSYEGGVEALNNISFKVPSRSTIAIVGDSGAGKSTIFNLMLRLYDIDTGKITIGKSSISNIKISNLRNAISLVSQDTTIFNDTILNNIKLGKLNATHSELVEVSKKVNVDSFVTNLELGYDTVLGENGIALSGGQSQRISIARALLKDSPILLLDEATSALDTINETEIQKSFQEFFELKTVIIIAHRLSTVLNSDNILVMKDGQLIDQGCHDDLIKRNAYYKKLTKMHLID
ncbi:ABC transporter ATP-binding protein/permease [Hyphomicrobiales bacterium]|nr:ABC transporter ATP-binding protein/permease [Hyphomicrobiales bacterium]